MWPKGFRDSNCTAVTKQNKSTEFSSGVPMIQMFQAEPFSHCPYFKGNQGEKKGSGLGSPYCEVN